MTTTAPRDIPGASNPSNPKTQRTRANTFSYPRWDADGNSHHPPPDTGASMSQSTRSPSSPSMAASPSNGGSSSSILRMLGLSPTAASSASSPSSSALPPLLQSDRADGLHNGHANHRRGASYGGQAAVYASPFYEDDEDGPPEAVTPPMDMNVTDHSTAAGAKKTINGNHGGSSLPRPTDYGHELDAAHKFELDDVFDASSTIPTVKSPPPPASAAIYGAPLGRRASWSPAVHTSAYSSSPPQPAAPAPGVLSWLHGQQTSYPISSSSSSAAQHASSQQSAPVNPNAFGSSPVGLFRRLSLSVNRRPPPPASVSTISEISASDTINNDKERIGRPLARVTSAPPRKLSPMGERMLRAHYDSFS